jgi:UDP-N-acetyl-D-mannosaminuronic acid dehydrogenase
LGESTTTTTKADVCIIGLGYVGLTLATAFAVAGLRVIGVERNSEVVELIAEGKAQFHEEGLDEALREVVADGRLSALDSASAAPAAKAYIITVGTPLRDGSIHLEDIEDALRKVSEWMPDGALVVLRSTVRVGTTSGLAAATLSESGRPFALAMAPERTIEGKALAELTSLPQIIGGIDANSSALAAELFSRLGVEIVHVSSPAAAELAKLSSNTYRDLQFAFANELAYFADTAGVDVYDVVRACNYGYDRMNLALPGPVAGPCLEKDAYILSDSATQLGIEVPLSMQGRKTNERIVAHVQTMVGGMLDSSPAVVGILGLAFKGRPATSDVRGSLAADFARSFASAWPGARMIGWDPLVSVRDSESMGVDFEELSDVLSSAEFVLVQTNHRFFSSQEFVDAIATHARPGAMIVDLWNQLDGVEDVRTDIRVVTLGRMTAGVS